MTTILDYVGVSASDLAAMAARLAAIELETKSTSWTTVSTSGTYTVLSTDTYIAVNATAGDVNIAMLPKESGRYIRIIRLDSTANTVTVTANGTDKLDDATTITLPSPHTTVGFRPNPIGYTIEVD